MLAAGAYLGSMAFPEVREFPVLKYTGLPDLVRSNGSPRSVFFARRSTLFFHDFPNASPRSVVFCLSCPSIPTKPKLSLRGRDRIFGRGGKSKAVKAAREGVHFRADDGVTKRRRQRALLDKRKGNALWIAHRHVSWHVMHLGPIEI